MNISFFLKPKFEVSFLYDDLPARTALNDMMQSGFTAIPVIDRKGRYIGTIGEGDFLRLILNEGMEALDQTKIGQVPRRLRHQTVSIDASIEGMVGLVTDQNFVPVIDGRGMFIGIITRHDIMRYMTESQQQAARA